MTFFEVVLKSNYRVKKQPLRVLVGRTTGTQNGPNEFDSQRNWLRLLATLDQTDDCLKAELASANAGLKRA